MFKHTLRSISSKYSTLFIVYIVLALFASIQLVSLGTHEFTMPKHNLYANDIVNNPTTLKLFVGYRFTDYNNYIVFKQSFFHLAAGKNLYTIYPQEQWDLFKYSPTFALLMGALAYLPDILGLSIWNLLNALILFLAIKRLPFPVKTGCQILWFIAIELLTSLQNAQSNALLGGLMILAFSHLRNGRHIWAALYLVLATYIKLYGAIGFMLFLFYPDKLKFILYACLWTVLLAVLPLLITPYHNLIWQYQNWAQMLAADQSASYGLSVMGWLHSWFGLQHGKNIVVLVGILLFFLPFTRFKLYKDITFQLLTLAAMLIWVIIFNHKAESPTFVIAVAGVAIWYFSKPAQLWRTVMLWMAFVFTCLTVTDLFPHSIKEYFFEPYVIKVVPCIIIWCITVAELLTLKKGQEGNASL